MKINNIISRIFILYVMCILLFLNGCKENNYIPKGKVLSGEYVGEISVDDNPKLFGSGLISTNLSERDVAISPDGKEFYYTLWTGTYGVILVLRENEDGWSKPEIVSFSKEYSNLEPFITDDGNRLFFASNRSTEPEGKTKDYDIWFVERNSTSWGSPINVGPPINTDKDEFYPSVAANGNLYFTAERENTYGSEDIWMSEYKDGKYLDPVNPGTAINSGTDEFNAYVAPDESYLIFSNWGRDDGYGGGDLYISFKNTINEWQPSVNLGEKINSTALDFCPYISHDGKYFFFTSRRTSDKLENLVTENYSSLVSTLNGPQNGQNDIYWINTSFLDSIRVND